VGAGVDSSLFLRIQRRSRRFRVTPAYSKGRIPILNQLSTQEGAFHTFIEENCVLERIWCLRFRRSKWWNSEIRQSLRRDMKRSTLRCSRALMTLIFVIHPSHPEPVSPNWLRFVSTGGVSSLLAELVLLEELP
jgi:hypothetical protein